MKPMWLQKDVNRKIAPPFRMFLDLYEEKVLKATKKENILQGRGNIDARESQRIRSICSTGTRKTGEAQRGVPAPGSPDPLSYGFCGLPDMGHFLRETREALILSSFLLCLSLFR